MPEDLSPYVVRAEFLPDPREGPARDPLGRVSSVIEVVGALVRELVFHARGIGFVAKRPQSGGKLPST